MQENIGQQLQFCTFITCNFVYIFKLRDSGGFYIYPSTNLLQSHATSSRHSGAQSEPHHGVLEKAVLAEESGIAFV